MKVITAEMNTWWLFQLISNIWPHFLFYQFKWWVFPSCWQPAYLWNRWTGPLTESSRRGRRMNSIWVPQQRVGRYECRRSPSSNFSLQIEESDLSWLSQVKRRISYSWYVAIATINAKQMQSKVDIYIVYLKRHTQSFSCPLSDIKFKTNLNPVLHEKGP